MSNGMVFEDNSNYFKNVINEKADIGLTKVGELIKGQIAKNAPADTGGLRASIEYEKQINGQNSSVTIGSTKAYAPYVEYGTGEFATNGVGRKGGWRFKDSQGKWWFTKGQHPTHFMRDSFQQNEKKMHTILEQEFGGVGNG